jgi:hypothetical protein
MNGGLSLILYLVLGTAGGLAGSRLKIPGATLLGSMLAVILFQVAGGRSMALPKTVSFCVQILVEVMVGTSYTPELGRVLPKIFLPILASTLSLVLVGFVTSLILGRLGVLDAATAYLGTSPGAISAMISLAVESQANATVVLAFHFFRVVFVIVTAPLVFFLMRLWIGGGG